MTSQIASPLDLEIQDFAHYGLIIDARSPREFEGDHIPGATNLPVVFDDEYAQVGTMHKDDKHRAYMIGVAYSLRNMATALEQTIATLPKDTNILVYCFRGGKRSRLWMETLRTIGFRTKLLVGGWKAYRRWVLASLDTVPTQFQYRVLSGPTGCGKTRLLEALRAQGAQVLDLEGLAKHRGSLIGAIPGVTQPPQMMFDSILLDTIRKMDTNRPIWVEAESKKIGNLQLPTSLLRAMHDSPYYRVDAPMSERVRLWKEDYGHFEANPAAFLEKLAPLNRFVGNAELAHWHALAAENNFALLFERLMTQHYDPAYDRSSGRNYPQYEKAERLVLDSLAPNALNQFARTLITKN